MHFIQKYRAAEESRLRKEDISKLIKVQERLIKKIFSVIKGTEYPSYPKSIKNYIIIIIVKRSNYKICVIIEQYNKAY